MVESRSYKHWLAAIVIRLNVIESCGASEKLVYKRFWRLACILGLILLTASVATMELFAFDAQQLQTASLITKYEDGYLISIINKNALLDTTGLEKYEAILPENNRKLIYKAVDINDYSLLERKYDFSLKNKIIIFDGLVRSHAA